MSLEDGNCVKYEIPILKLGVINHL